MPAGSDIKREGGLGEECLGIACIGEVMLELNCPPNGAISTAAAGDTYNTAVYLRRFSNPSRCRVSYVTSLGRDPVSDRIFSAIENHGIDTSYIERIPELAPGLYAISTGANGERSFTYWRANSAARQMFGPASSLTLLDLLSFDLVYLSGITLAVLSQEVRERIYQWADRFRGSGGKIVFDSNYRANLWPSRQVAQDETMKMWSRCDVALPSLSDESELFGDVDENATVDRLASVGARWGCLKRGHRGPMCLSGTSFDFPQVPDSQVIDTTAAGDSFNAGYLAAMINGACAVESARVAHRLASLVIQHRGAIVPTSDKLFD